MKDWHGVTYHSIQDALARDSIAEINDFLFQLSPSIANLDRGKKSNSSGDSTGTTGDFLFKPGLPENQIAHGGTHAGGYLKFRSTRHPTKGFVFLGEDTGLAFDETNTRIGLNQPTPTARLHMVVGEPQDQPGKPSAQLGRGGWTGNGGEITDMNLLLDEDVADDGDYLFHLDNTTGTLILGIEGMTDPGVNTGHYLKVRARKTSATDPSVVLLVNMDNGGSSFMSSSITLTTSFVTTTIPLSSGEAGAISSYTNMRFGATISDPGAGDGNVHISWVRFFTPAAGGGAGSEVLQKWATPTVGNQLAYAADAFNATTLELSGSPKLRIATSGLEFDIGSPVVGTVWSATDTEGTGAWATLASLGAASSAEPFVTIGNTSGLSAERALTGSTRISVTDNGVNSTVVLDAIGAALTRTNDTNVTLTLDANAPTALVNASALVLGWTGTLAAARLNSNVVQSVVNGTNVTGSISAQALTLGWTGTLAPPLGGTGFASYAVGDILYADTTTTLAKRAATTNGFVLTLTGGIPVWAAAAATYTDEQAQDAVGAMVGVSLVYDDPTPFLVRAALTGDITAAQNSNATTLASIITAGGPTGSASVVPVITWDAKGRLTAVTTATTVSSVALSGGTTGLTVSGSPITSTGTITLAGTLVVANGGTGLTAGTSGGILGFTGTGTLASSVALTASALVLGGGAGATPTPMGSLGTTTTVLHGNAAGAPTFAAVALADMSTVATSTVFYRKTAGTGIPEVNTLATLKTDLGLTGTNSGDQTITLTGDVTGSGTSSFAATIANDAVTFAKFQNITDARLLGRSAGSSGDMQEITVGTGLSLSAGSLTATGVASVANPTGRAQLAAGFSNGSAATAMRSDSDILIDETIAPTWTGQHIHDPATDVTALLVKSTNGSGGLGNTFESYNPSGLKVFAIRQTGRVVFGANDAGMAGIVRMDIQSQTTNGANVVQAVYGGNYTAWSLGTTGGFVVGDVSANGTGVVRFQINQGSGQTADMLRIAATGGINLVKVNSAGVFSLAGTTSGEISFGLQAIAGTYNFNLPTSAGSAGQPLLSGGGGAAAQTYGILGIAGGGSNKALTLVIGGILWTDADSFEVSAAGSLGQLLRSGGAAAPTWTTATFPVTAGTSGNVLTSDGTNWSSAAPAGGGAAHNLLTGAAGTHTDTALQGCSRGSMIIGNTAGTPLWDELVVGTANAVPWTDGTDVKWNSAPTAGTAHIDFKTAKAIAMVCDNGATLPTSPTPVSGQWFLHTPTGRKVLMQYTGAAWQPIISIGAMVMYVDKAGTDSQNGGTAAGASAFLTPQFAVDQIPPIFTGHVNINFTAGTGAGNANAYTAPAITGKAPSGVYYITLQGDVLQETGTALSTMSFTAYSAGNSTTQATVTAAAGTFPSTAKSCGTTLGSRSVTSATLFGNVRAGMFVSGTGIPAGARVTKVTDTSNLLISKASTSATSTYSLSFTIAGTVILFVTGNMGAVKRVVDTQDSDTQITLAGAALAGATNAGTFTVYPLNTSFQNASLSLSSTAAGIIFVFDIACDDPTFAGAFCAQGSTLFAQRCCFTGNVGVSALNNQMAPVYVLDSSFLMQGSGPIGINIEQTSQGQVFGSVLSAGTGTGTKVGMFISSASLGVFRSGSVVKGFDNGLTYRGNCILQVLGSIWIKSNTIGETCDFGSFKTNLAGGTVNYANPGGTSSNTLDQQGIVVVSGQSAALSATNVLLAPFAGVYNVLFYATTATTITNTVTFTLSWTDPVGARTTTFTLTAGASQSGALARTIKVASGNVTISGTATGGGTYNLDGNIIQL